MINQEHKTSMESGSICDTDTAVFESMKMMSDVLFRTINCINSEVDISTQLAAELIQTSDLLQSEADLLRRMAENYGNESMMKLRIASDLGQIRDEIERATNNNSTA